MKWRPASDPPKAEGEYLTAYWQSRLEKWAYLVDTYGELAEGSPLEWFGDSDPRSPRVAYWCAIDPPPRPIR